jgi:hypothetical protein
VLRGAKGGERAGAQPEHREPPAGRGPLEPADRVVDVSERGLVPGQAVVAVQAVAEAGMIEAQHGEAGLGEPPRQRYPQALRADVVHDAGIEKQDGGRPGRDRRLREHAHQTPVGAEARHSFTHEPLYDAGSNVPAATHACAPA